MVFFLNKKNGSGKEEEDKGGGPQFIPKVLLFYKDTMAAMTPTTAQPRPLYRPVLAPALAESEDDNEEAEEEELDDELLLLLVVELVVVLLLVPSTASQIWETIFLVPVYQSVTFLSYILGSSHPHTVGKG